MGEREEIKIIIENISHINDVRILSLSDFYANRGGASDYGRIYMEAETLMLQVHKSNSAVVGIYSYDIAHSKVQKATRMARNEGFPLRLTVTPEEEE